MSGKAVSRKEANRTIAENRKARHDYYIEQTLEAGLMLEGWEVKSLRDGRANIKEGYAVIRNSEAWLVGANFSPLPAASTHVAPDPVRSRKLLLNRRELDRLVGAVEREGYTLVPLSLYWKKSRAKLALGLARGKKQHDKRASDRERDWNRQRQSLLRKNSKNR